MNPYQPGEDNQDPYEVGYKAGAASRDAEVVSLMNQRDYEYVRAENAEQERDQLTEAFEAWKRAQASELEAARAEIERLKTVPMRYRRMAFNAQLQDEVARLEQENDQLREHVKMLRDALNKMNRAYVNLIENARDRIIALGGDCDPVDMMERDDPNLRESKEALAKVMKP